MPSEEPPERPVDTFVDQDSHLALEEHARDSETRTTIKMMAADLTSSRVVARPGVRSGQPIIRGTRITVWDILGWLAAGATESEILEDYPDLVHEDLTPPGIQIQGTLIGAT